MNKGTKKANNRHAIGKGNGKFGKKEKRILNARSRTPRSFEEKLATAGVREQAKLLA